MIKRFQKTTKTLLFCSLRRLLCSCLICSLAVLVLVSCKTVPTDEKVAPIAPPAEQVNKEQPSTPSQQKSAKPSSFSPESFTEKLQSLLQKGDTKKALAAFDSIPAAYKDDPGLNYLHASLLLSAGDLALAREKTDLLLQKDPGNEDARLLSAMIAKASGNTKKSTDTIKSILQTNPKNADANAALAESFMLARNFKQANLYFRKGAEADPKHEASLLGFAQTSWYLGQTDKAKETLLKLTEINPKNAMAWSYLAKLADESRSYSQALEYIQKALEYDKDYYYHWLDAGSYYLGLNKYKEAEDAWTRAIKIEPDYFLAYAYRASLRDERKKYADALKDYRDVIRCNPKYYYAYESVAMLAWREGNWQESLDNFLKAYEMNSKNVSYQLMISACYQKMSNTTANKEFLSKAMKGLDKQSLDYLMLRLYYDGLADSAVLNKVVNNNSRTTKGKMLFYMALFYELKGNTPLANKLYLEVADMDSPLFFEYKLTQWAVEKMKPEDKQEAQ